MPTYEYECPKCRKTFDVVQSMKDAPLTRCPTCKGKIKRLLGSGAGIIFKGSGFYQTDYRSDGYKKSAKSESSASAPPAPAASSTSDSAKPAAKPAPTTTVKPK
jgi:putative FmdB family regulatory protein